MDDERMLRCEFAKAAMQAMVSTHRHYTSVDGESVARKAFVVAEAMIKTERALYNRSGVGKDIKWPKPPEQPAPPPGPEPMSMRDGSPPPPEGGYIMNPNVKPWSQGG